MLFKSKVNGEKPFRREKRLHKSLCCSTTSITIFLLTESALDMLERANGSIKRKIRTNKCVDVSSSTLLIRRPISSHKTVISRYI